MTGRGDLLVIDPGQSCGWAYYDTDGLQDCGVIRCDTKAAKGTSVRTVSEYLDRFMLGNAPEVLAAEWPQIYTRGKSKGDPNDLLGLAAIIGGAITMFPSASLRLYKPAEWKGRTTKEVCHARVRRALAATELATLNCALDDVIPSLRHNALDAVGIGLHALGRFKPKRVIAR